MPNRLADEPSPYLQQHAQNPVDWFPWGEEAFEAARRLDRPLFVSIGYATCHWCHVMERESFEDSAIAALMNDAFVNVKVDREERPDVDGIYMTVCQMLTGHGGWPLNVVLTPDRRPIFAGTYIPPTSMHGRIGMRELVPRLRQVWETERDRMETSAAEITRLLQQEAATDLRSPSAANQAVLSEAALLLHRQFDRVNHGFGSAPKFPMPHYIGLLLRHWRSSGSEDSLRMAVSTLESMSRGGIFDHVGFGFHRYSTDAKWLVPHFEKMLYDQALLLDAFVEGYQTTGNPHFARVARAIAEYVDRDLSSARGGFFSAEDADSEGVEGKFYVWSMDELREALGAEDADFAAQVYQASGEGNYFDEATGVRTGKNILHLRAKGDAEATESERTSSIRRRLFQRREGRIRPLLDDKILADWNGLMVASLARAGSALGEPELVERAAAAARFVDSELVDESGGMHHRFRNGNVGIRANLDDFAFFALACFELFLATGRGGWLQRSKDVTERAVEQFWDDVHAGFFFADGDESDLIVRRKEIQDGAIPSGLSAMVSNLARLGRILRREDLTTRANAAIESVGASLSRFPTAHTALINAFAELDQEAGEIVVVGAASAPSTQQMLSAARAGFHPGRLVILIDPERDGEAILEIAPHFREYKSIEGAPTAYVCRDFVCQAPTTSAERLSEQLQNEG